MAENDLELLNPVYREIADSLGIDTAMAIYRLFKGQQICFPVRLYSPDSMRELICREFDGTNARMLATKYNYSEKTVRRIIKNITKK